MLGARRRQPPPSEMPSLVPVERVQFAIRKRPQPLENSTAIETTDPSEEGIPFPETMLRYETPDDDVASHLAEVKEGQEVGQPAEPLEDRRSAERKPIFSGARLLFPGGREYECMIVDYSKTGVRLRFRTKLQLPEYLAIVSQRPLLNTPARTVWQDGNTAALHFLQKDPSDPQLSFDF